MKFCLTFNWFHWGHYEYVDEKPPEKQEGSRLSGTGGCGCVGHIPMAGRASYGWEWCRAGDGHFVTDDSTRITLAVVLLSRCIARLRPRSIRFVSNIL
ncbi:hypothetical protein AVEN_224875-1 [Araneus ventricosus]|uniref:Uncharacterized protein n=1 Tax=Araneus ventricosus TaxID=182803 RepID=A0A4Y2GTW3_ARAVE|nr:hypothetical protein AVEN_224875-1 [Araneus ventricosus]